MPPGKEKPKWGRQFVRTADHSRVGREGRGVWRCEKVADTVNAHKKVGGSQEGGRSHQSDGVCQDCGVGRGDWLDEERGGFVHEWGCGSLRVRCMHKLNNDVHNAA